MWQSGRINFFWGGFPTFMVYALPLISTGYYFAVFDLKFLQIKHSKVVVIALVRVFYSYNIYIGLQ